MKAANVSIIFFFLKFETRDAKKVFFPSSEEEISSFFVLSSL